MTLARNIKIELEIHVITCPGVWLCQNSGDIELSITSLGYRFQAIPLPPRFPLCYHEKFVMDGYFSDVDSIANLEKALDEEPITFTLWQKGRRLAYYSNNIGVILNYTGGLNNKFARTDNAIIMTRGSCFPGTISPKMEYTAQLEYLAKCVKCNRNIPNYTKRFVKNLYENGSNKSFVHQKTSSKVCHSKAHRWQHMGNTTSFSNDDDENSVLCNYCLDSGRKDVHLENDRYNCCYLPDITHTDDALTQKSGCSHLTNNDIKSSHRKNDCMICLQYESLFDVSSEIK